MLSRMSLGIYPVPGSGLAVPCITQEHLQRPRVSPGHWNKPINKHLGLSNSGGSVQISAQGEVTKVSLSGVAA